MTWLRVFSPVCLYINDTTVGSNNVKPREILPHTRLTASVLSHVPPFCNAFMCSFLVLCRCVEICLSGGPMYVSGFAALSAIALVMFRLFRTALCFLVTCFVLFSARGRCVRVWGASHVMKLLLLPRRCLTSQPVVTVTACYVENYLFSSPVWFFTTWLRFISCSERLDGIDWVFVQNTFLLFYERYCVYYCCLVGSRIVPILPPPMYINNYETCKATV